MIDLAKLDRIEEQYAELLDAARARFARYRNRIEAAQHMRPLALVRAHYSVQHLSLAQLGNYTAAELRALDVDMEQLEAARRELQMAEKLLTDHYSRSKALNDSGTLLHTLKKHANLPE